MSLPFGRRKSRGVQKVVVVKPKRKRKRRIATNLLKKKTTVKMTYAETIQIDPAIAGVTTHVFRCNSINDPDFTGGGHQPLLHDTYEQLYGNYRVISSSIKVTPVTTTSSGVIPAFWGVFTDTNSSLDYTLASAAIEDKTRTKRFSQYNGPASVFNGAMPNSLKASFNSRMLGKEGANAVVPFGENPIADNRFTRFYQVWAGSILANNPGILSFLVELTYIVELTSPLTVLQS